MSKIIWNKVNCNHNESKDSFLINHKNLSSTKKVTKHFLYKLVSRSHWVHQNQSQHNLLHAKINISE